MPHKRKDWRMSVIEHLIADYRDFGTDEASDKLSDVTSAIRRSITAAGKQYRSIGTLLNSIDGSGLIAEAMGLAHDTDGRTSAMAAYCKDVGITKQQATAWRKDARVDAARITAGMPKQLAGSAGRGIAADASEADIAAMLKTYFVDESTRLTDEAGKATKPNRESIAEAAKAAGIGTAAGTEAAAKNSGGNAPAADVDAPESDASRVRALASELRTITEAGYCLPAAIVRHLEATIAGSEAAKAEAKAQAAA